MNNQIDLTQLTSREIAQDAVRILYQFGYTKAKEMTKDHMRIVNERLLALNKELNKALGLHKKPTQVRIVTDFKRFR